MTDPLKHRDRNRNPRPRLGRDRTASLATLAWNVKNGQVGGIANVLDQLEEWADDHEVNRIVLTEARLMHPHLRAWAKHHGWKHRQERPVKGDLERGDVAVLIRTEGPHAARLRRRWVAVMVALWMVVRYRTRRDPRRYERSKIRRQGHTFWTSAEHWPTGEGVGPNAAAWRETRDRARKFLSRRGTRILDGDQNARRDQIVALTTTAAKGRPCDVSGERPDWCAVVDGSTSSKRLQTRLSDHDAYVHTVRALKAAA